MNYSVKQIPLQKLVTGDILSITVHTFVGSQSESSCYLQANLHGPEILGSALLIKLLSYLREHEKELIGRITMIPQANPIGVQQQIYGYQIGRWNLQNGNNWNRIFSKEPSQELSVENNLRAVLLQAAADHQIILDIHTSGAACTTHLFTQEEDVAFFSPLQVERNILVTPEDYYGAFDECCRTMAKQRGRSIRVATWEVGSHASIQQDVLDERFVCLLYFLRSTKVLKMTENNVSPSIAPWVHLKQHTILYAQDGGYLVWSTCPSKEVKRGEMYGYICNPKNGETKPQFAAENFFFLIRDRGR